MTPNHWLFGEEVRHVVWDWNGTLLDDHELCIAVMNVFLREASLSELDVPRYRSVFDFPVRRYYERLGFSLDAAEWEALAARFISEYDRRVEGCRLHTGATEILASLSAAGVRHTILSAARRTSVEELLERRGLEGYFDGVVGLDDHYAGGKLHLGVQWIKTVRADPTSVVLVGDTVHDHEVAQAMGIRCVLVASGHQGRDRLERCGCPVVDRLADLHFRHPPPRDG